MATAVEIVANRDRADLLRTYSAAQVDEAAQKAVSEFYWPPRRGHSPELYYAIKNSVRRRNEILGVAV